MDCVACVVWRLLINARLRWYSVAARQEEARAETQGRKGKETKVVFVTSAMP
jgi:hypothetical protein